MQKGDPIRRRHTNEVARPVEFGWNAPRTNLFSAEASRASGKVDLHDRTGAAARTSSMSDLKGRVAVVTGASKGIGAAIAKSLSAAGAAVVANYVSKDGADRVVADIKANGGKAIAV
jgi:3-oxoacyl-ACP reductase-like protein